MMGRKTAEPGVFVIFGGTGDLSRRKLLPALCRLSERGELQECHIVGLSRNALTDDAFRQVALDALAEAGCSPESATAFAKRLHAHSIGAGTSEDYRGLAARLSEIERKHGLPDNRLFYLSLPPGAVPATAAGLGGAGLSKSSGWTRLIVEKPFGHDLESALKLNGLLHDHFEESQIYRIDHYLGKETVQNLMVLRFANVIFESLWNRERVRAVEITVAEDIGVGTRAGYYDKSGALRDMVQNHITQLVTLVGMEVPSAFDASAIRYEKIKVLRSIAPLDPSTVVRGQYTAGEIGEKRVRGYLPRRRRRTDPCSPPASWSSTTARRTPRTPWSRPARASRWLPLGENRGFPAAVNAGIAASTAPLIALLNSDALAEPGWLEALVGALDADPAISLGASRMLFPDGTVNAAGDAFDVRGRGGYNRGIREPDGPRFDRPRIVFGACAGPPSTGARCSPTSACSTGPSGSRGRTSTSTCAPRSAGASLPVRPGRGGAARPGVVLGGSRLALERRNKAWLALRGLPAPLLLPFLALVPLREAYEARVAREGLRGWVQRIEPFVREAPRAARWRDRAPPPRACAAAAALLGLAALRGGGGELLAAERENASASRDGSREAGRTST